MKAHDCVITFTKASPLTSYHNLLLSVVDNMKLFAHDLFSMAEWLEFIQTCEQLFGMWFNIWDAFILTVPFSPKSVLNQKDEEDTYVNNVNFVGMYDIGDEEFTIGKENTVEVPETGEVSTWQNADL